MNGSVVIETEGMFFSYDGASILEDVHITIKEQDFVVIVGPNGGGKTTLIKLILGLLRPTAGGIRVFGVSPEEARPRMGYMPQSAQLDSQFPAGVMDVVLMGRLGRRTIFGRYSKADKEAAAEALREVGLHALHARPFSALSGGERQRVLIARALACEPEMLILDEPAAGLDAMVAGEFYELLRDFNRRMTVVMVSHDLGIVSKHVKTVMCVKNTVFSHPIAEITGEMINSIYGTPMGIVRHDLMNSKEGR
ncbi:metal ABC transporter ATP-binding protein [Thermodesulfobacteriota bacterium]